MDENIRRKIEFGKIIKEANRRAKREECFLCGKKVDSFCNSHVVPQMVLREIAENGKILSANAAVQLDFLDVEKGVNNSGTIHFICRECDSKYFQDYENEKALSLLPTNRMMAEIALKNILMQLNKRANEVKLYDMMEETGKFHGRDSILQIQKMDMADYEFSFKRIMKILGKNLKSGYHLLYWKKLPYKVPIATQVPIVLDVDLEGREVNNIWSDDPKDRMQDLHVCVFPIKTESILIIFYHKDDRKYVAFEKQFNRLSENDKIKWINYVIFKYTENYFFSPKIENVIKTDKKLQELSAESFGLPNLGHITNPMNFFYEGVKPDEITNILDYQYRLE